MGTATFGQRGEVIALQKFDKIRAWSLGLAQVSDRRLFFSSVLFLIIAIDLLWILILS